MKPKHIIAKALYRGVKAARGLAGKNDNCTVTRRGIRYELDLSQGIDFAIYLLGAWEAATHAAIARCVKSGQTVLDIGANVGAVTLNLAQSVGSDGCVVAFEPTQFAYRKLLRNIELNPDLAPRIRPLHVFLGAKDKTTVPSSIFASWPLIGSGSVHPKHLGKAEATAGATTRRLDSLIKELELPRIDFVKLDVDGYECEVLAGAKQLLTRDRPTFLIELAPYVHAEQGHSFERFLEYFFANGYLLFDEHERRLLPSSATELRELIGDDTSINAIAIGRDSIRDNKHSSS